MEANDNDNRYNFVECLGTGAFGTVYRAYDKSQRIQVAVKQVTLEINKTSLRRMLREILFLKYLRHEHLVNMKDAFWMFEDDKIKLFFVMPLMKCNMRRISNGNVTVPSMNHIK